MRKNVYLFMFMAFLCCSFTAFGQSTITGSVWDAESGEPLIGATIAIKGKVAGTISDFDGNFELNTGEAFPLTLIISYTGYTTQEVAVSAAGSVGKIELETAAVLTDEVVVSASRVEESILEAPVTIEKLDPIAIRQSSTPDYYDGLANLKEVSVVSGSMTLTSVNTRGFGAVANERFVQLMDGMDNAAPLLNFPTGNIVGIGELDIHSVELVPGAASALYGPNAFNGILLMNSKNPFRYQGLSVQTKYGITDSDAGGSDPYYQVAARYAKAFNDKFAFKLNVSYLKATDWRANNYTSGRETEAITNPSGVGAPNFDGLNMYGDEVEIVVPMAAVAAPLSAALAGPFSQATGIPVPQMQAILRGVIPALPSLDLRRTGFREEDLLANNDASSLKADAALHYRLTEDVEVSLNYRYGSGNTVYQGGERYVLDGFNQQFLKLEFTGSNFFLRGYTSFTDAGDSYNLSALGAFANERFRPTAAAWVPTYAGTYAANLIPILLQGGSITPAAVAAAHAAGRAAADAGIPRPGSAEWQAVVDATREDFFQRNPPGAGFFDDSRLSHVEGNYNFKDKIKIFDLLVGGNFRQYNLFSDGTIFNENPDGVGDNERIKINEWGAYAQISKKLANDRLKLTGSVRYDKNENFDGQFSPRLSGVYSAGANREHNFRASFQTGFRNPGTQAQFIFFPSSSGTLLGSAEANAQRYGVHNGGAYTNQSYNAFLASVLAGAPNPGLLQTVNIPYVQPERLTAYEIGYKTIINKKLFLDINYYRNNYQDPIVGQTVRVKAGTSHQGVALPGVDDVLAGRATSATPFRPYVNASEEITSNGVGVGFRYNLAKNYQLYGNYNYASFEVIDPGPDFEAGFNLPENRFVVGLSNRKLAKNLGFDVSYRWQDAFEWQNSFAFGDIPAYGVVNAQFNYNVESLKTVVKLGGTNLFGDDYVTNAGGPFIGRMYYISLTFDEFMN